MGKTIEKITESDPPKQTIDPRWRLKSQLFYARLLITILAMGLFGYLVSEMLQMKEEMTNSSKDITMLALGSFLPILGAVSKFWLDPSDEHGDNTSNNQPPIKDEK
tara:strand:- start:262 stop:579 length:318 start_codon:yes stop_codon:yes gene_type:complete